jgi:hypothetical protein
MARIDHVKTNRAQVLWGTFGTKRRYRIFIDHPTEDVRVALLQKFTAVSARPGRMSMVWRSRDWEGGMGWNATKVYA